MATALKMLRVQVMVLDCSSARMLGTKEVFMEIPLDATGPYIGQIHIGAPMILKTKTVKRLGPKAAMRAKPKPAKKERKKS